MKRLSFLAMFVAMVLGASAQYYMHVWSDGATYSMPVLNVDSVTFTDGPLENVPNEPQEPAQGIGVFSVGEGKTVTFSPGNLQYTQSTNTWSFASAQYEVLGTDNVIGGTVTSDEYGYDKSGTALADKVDLFGWSTSTTNFGVSASTDYNDYSGSFVDWGTNKIGNDAPNTWRTLSYDEWYYLRYTRTNADALCGVAQVNGVNGLILLPDNWTCPAGITFKSGFHSNYGVDYYAAYQTFTAAEWSKLEAAGAVVLPAAGYRDGTDVYYVQSHGRYWSATEYYSRYALCLFFFSVGARMLDYNRDYGFSVRLVKDVEGENIDPEQPGEGGEEPGEPDPGTPDTPEEPTPVVGVFSVAEGKTVTFSPGNLQYTQSTDTWSFASTQWEMLGTDNVTGGSVFSDQHGDKKYGDALADKVDLFGWSTSATNFGVSTSTNDNDYSGSFVDWGTNTIDDYIPNTWRTLTLIEWRYLLNNRPNASSLKGVAQVNGVNGLILLPNNWTCPAGVTFKSGFHSEWGVDYYAAYQTFTADQWSTLEKSGAVFLPASGRRVGTNVDYVQDHGYYWSANEGGVNNFAFYLHFSSDGASVAGSYRYLGHSVRLVKDVEDETTEPETPEEDEEPETPTAGIGSFSVSASKQVTFSPGNLQYTQSTNTWSFAENQWEMIGTDNVTGGSVSSYEYGDWKEGTALADKIDLFGFSTSATYFGVSISTDLSGYNGSFVDWGKNQIGADAPNTWRTLSKDEWEYLLNGRNNATSLGGVAQVNGVNGLIFLPDNWTCPAGVTFKSGYHSSYGAEYYAAYQTFTAAEWSKLEAAGAVFLPAAGDRLGSSVYNVQYDGFYWSATGYDSRDVYYLCFGSSGAGMYDGSRRYGHSVRLVKDVEDETTEPETPEEDEEPETPTAGIGSFSVSASKQVTFSPGNLQYTQSTNTWSFAENQWEMIGTDNVTGGSVSSNPTYGDYNYGTALADKIDLFGWSTSTTNFGVSTSEDYNDYSGSFVDWGKKQIGADTPNTWRTLSDDEWEYLLNGRNNATSLCGVAQVNGVNGLIFLPDNWTCPAGVTFKSGFHSEWDRDYYYYAAYQTFTAEQWSKLEKSGAVFLPAAGCRYGSNVDGVQYSGGYWSATEGYYDYDASCLDFYSGEAYMDYYYRYVGFSVRLVKDL